MSGIIGQYKPDELYNLAANSFVASSFSQPVSVFNIDAVGVLNILESVRTFSPKTKVYQSSSSECWGSNYSVGPKDDKYQDENTPFSPNSPYAVAKVAAHNLVKIYREGYGMFACCGLLHNNTSPRRGEEFVTRKITKWIGEFTRFCNTISGKYSCGLMGDDIVFFPIHSDKSIGKTLLFPSLKLGNIDSYRAWFHSKDAARAMYTIMQNDSPTDYVVSADKTHSVREFLQTAFECANLGDYNQYITIDKNLFRPVDVPYLSGKADKIRNELGWEPTITFDEIVKEMVEYDINEAKQKISNC